MESNPEPIHPAALVEINYHTLKVSFILSCELGTGGSQENFEERSQTMC